MEVPSAPPSFRWPSTGFPLLSCWTSFVDGRSDLGEVKSLKQKSDMIQGLSAEADVKQFTRFPVIVWLDGLKQLLYDVDDILDAFATEVLRLKLKYENQTHLRQTQQGIGRFGSKVREDESLKGIAQEGIVLGLNPSIASGSSRPKVFSQRPRTSSLVNSSKVFGREEDIWKIVKWLLLYKTLSHPGNTGSNFSVLSIIGMGGIGKTNLAQLVYNDDMRNENYGRWDALSSASSFGE